MKKHKTKKVKPTTKPEAITAESIARVLHEDGVRLARLLQKAEPSIRAVRLASRDLSARIDLTVAARRSLQPSDQHNLHHVIETLQSLLWRANRFLNPEW